MRVAILSDIHGNLLALSAVLEDLERQGPLDHLVVAGDLCVFGPQPKEVLARLRDLPCEIIQGNTDLWLIDPSSMPEGDSEASEIAEWTRGMLDDDDLALISRLRFSYEIAPVRGHSLLIVHANPHDLIAPIRMDTDLGEITRLTENVMAEVLAFGHVHIPFIRRVGGLTLACVGSVGAPLDEDVRPCYAILEWDGDRWLIQHHRVPYDVKAAIREIQHSGIPHAKKRAALLRAARRP